MDDLCEAQCFQRWGIGATQRSGVQKGRHESYSPWTLKGPSVNLDARRPGRRQRHKESDHSKGLEGRNEIARGADRPKDGPAPGRPRQQGRALSGRHRVRRPPSVERPCRPLQGSIPWCPTPGACSACGRPAPQAISFGPCRGREVGDHHYLFTKSVNEFVGCDLWRLLSRP